MNDLQIFRLENSDVACWDFALLKAELQRRLDSYAGLVYTDETIKNARTDRAALNKAKRVIEDARKAYKARCLAPYEALEPQIKELVDMVDRQRVVIDETVKDYENRQKEAKELELRKYYDRKAVVLGVYADSLYSRIFNKKWISAATPRKKYEEEILSAINGAAADMDAIRATGSSFVDSLLKCYAKTMSMEQVKAKQVELETILKKANHTATEEEAAAVGTPTASQAAAPQISVNSEEGTVLKVYASQKQINQIADFLKAIGVRYELL